ncbi:hypothetical protein DPEC_G00030500 [Dallia pectoralis]|uniref:Uncharacterized protein n=1 Tax=Dallia pectoralis TaxID=75939 RepID=A0ACC2HCD2_DALPE|nr:hypothetical protein DPEC_G00030500 [Dallia pectoralis]
MCHPLSLPIPHTPSVLAKRPPGPAQEHCCPSAGPNTGLLWPCPQSVTACPKQPLLPSCSCFDQSPCKSHNAFDLSLTVRAPRHRMSMAEVVIWDTSADTEQPSVVIPSALLNTTADPRTTTQSRSVHVQ